MQASQGWRVRTFRYLSILTKFIFQVHHASLFHCYVLIQEDIRRSYLAMEPVLNSPLHIVSS